jgi:segregation and condensation protein A
VRRSLAAALAHSGSLNDLHIDLDVFDGPFDLLVTLILKEEVDLWEVRVSRIVADYVLQLAESDEFDLEATSHFIVMVAALLEMKSRRLLSDGILSDEDDEFLDDELAGEELVVALQRYAQYKRAAASLLERHEAYAGRVYRRLPVPERFLRRRDDGARLPASCLVDSLAILLAEPPVPDVSHITDLAVSVLKELHRLRGLLQREGEFSFASVAPRDRLAKAVTFFALLELHNSGEVRLHQSRAFADIVVRRLDGATPLPVDDALPAVG